MSPKGPTPTPAVAPVRRRPPCRNVQATRERILEAVGALLARDGFGALGVNAVAQEACVDKVLIYRYFGGLDGLLEAFAHTCSFWPSFEELAPDPEALQVLPPSARMGLVFRRFVAALRERPLTIEILAWEGVAHTPLTRVLDEVRERLGLRLVAELAADAAPREAALLSTVFGAAVQHLLVRARHVSQYNGLDLGAEATWEDLARLLEAAAQALQPPPSPATSPARGRRG